METNTLAEELLKLEAKSLSERIRKVTKDNYQEVIPEIANLEDEIEKELLIKILSKKLEVSYHAVKKEVKANEKEIEQTISNENLIIAHPAFHVDKDFMSLDSERPL